MSIKLGLVGPEDSLTLIKTVAREFKNLNIREKNYDRYDDLKDIENFSRGVDILLFSGQAPYYWAKANADIATPAVFIPRNGTCLYRAFFDIYKEGINLSSLSFDTIGRGDIKEVYQELKIPVPKIYTMAYDRYLSFETVIDYHVKLWEKGKVKAAITCLNHCYNELKRKKIPTYRIHPTKSIIRKTIERALFYGESVKLKATQIALILVRVDISEEESDGNISFVVQKNLLELHRILLDYGQENQAMVIKTKDAEFAIVTTRGFIEESTNIYLDSPLLKNIRSYFPYKVYVGMGFGHSVKLAEANARAAIKLSKDFGGDCCFLMTEESKIIGPIVYKKYPKSKIVDMDIHDQAEKLKMNLMTVNKIKNILRILNKTEMTPKEFSIVMNISERNARRILSQLEKHGGAVEIGTKSTSRRGRPQKVYKVLL